MFVVGLQEGLLVSYPHLTVEERFSFAMEFGAYYCQQGANTYANLRKLCKFGLNRLRSEFLAITIHVVNENMAENNKLVCVWFGGYTIGMLASKSDLPTGNEIIARNAWLLNIVGELENELS